MKARVCEALFEAIKAHFAELFARRYLALSLELVEFSEVGTLKQNNIHARFRKSPIHVKRDGGRLIGKWRRQ